MILHIAILVFVVLAIAFAVFRGGKQDPRGDNEASVPRGGFIGTLFSKWWALIVTFIAIANFMWGPMRGVYAGGILVLSIVLLFLQAVVRLMRHTELEQWRLRVAVALLILPFALISIISLIHISALIGAELKLEKSFEERVDPFIYGAEKLYEPGIWPAWVYRFIHEDLFGGIYRPEIYNTSQSFERYDAVFYHVDTVGVTRYDCAGGAYPAVEASRDVYFICQAENRNQDSTRIRVWNNRTNAECRSAPPREVEIGGTQAQLIHVFLDEEFDYTRVFCHSDAMTMKSKERDGFVFDMGHISHPPESSNVVLVTNQRIRNPRIVRMVPEQSFLSWLRAQPKFISGSRPALKMSVSTDDSLREVYREHILHYRKLAAGGAENVQPVELPNVYTGLVENQGSGDIYLVEYELE